MDGLRVWAAIPWLMFTFSHIPGIRDRVFSCLSSLVSYVLLFSDEVPYVR